MTLPLMGKYTDKDKCGTMGLDLVGVVASIYVDYWDKKLIEILLEERIFAKNVQALR